MKSLTDLVVALDFDQVADAEKLMTTLGDLPVVYKVGLELFATVGPDWVRQQTKSGKRIFLDLKLYDIPNTVAKTILKIDQMGVAFTTVHLSGGRRMLDQIANMKPESSPLKILGVSVLTSFQEEEWTASTTMVAKPGSARSIRDSVSNFASMAQEHSALSGMVCSPQEISDIRINHPNLYLMVPGIRPEGSEKNDQARIMTPAEAALAGASAIVVGRPITQSKNPRLMTEQILQALSPR